MRYSVEISEKVYVKGYGFLPFVKNMGKNLSNKYGQKLFDNAKKPTTDAIKTASKRAIQKTVEATGDLVGDKIADKIANASKSLQCACKMMMIIVKQKYQKKDAYVQKKDNKILMN